MYSAATTEDCTLKTEQKHKQIPLRKTQTQYL